MTMRMRWSGWPEATLPAIHQAQLVKAGDVIKIAAKA